MRTDPDRWFGGHTPKTVTPNPQATLILQGPAPGARTKPRTICCRCGGLIWWIGGPSGDEW